MATRIRPFVRSAVVPRNDFGLDKKSLGTGGERHVETGDLFVRVPYGRAYRPPHGWRLTKVLNGGSNGYALVGVARKP